MRSANDEPISPVFLPLSGSEPKYVPTKWNSREKMRETHNCYAYFLQDLELRKQSKSAFPQPGSFALNRRKVVDRYSDDASTGGALSKIKEPYTCKEISTAVLSDNPSILPGERDAPCPKNYYKGFMAVDSDEKDSDYHFWVQHSDGSWSHKPGKLNVTQHDSSGNKIIDPLLSDRGRYKTPCGYYCVPSNAYAKTNSWS